MTDSARVTGIARGADGWRLDTADGATYTCETVVNAAGFWADEVARMVGARVPITNMEHHYLVTETIPGVAARGAVFGQACGWERALWFAPAGVAARDEPSFTRPSWWAPVGAECRALAERVALAELSSYTKLAIEGPGAERFLDRVTTNRVPRADGEMVLTLMLDRRGGVVGDVVACRLAAGRYYLVGATLAEAYYRRWLDSQVDADDVAVRVVTAAFGALGVAGPASRALLAEPAAGDVSGDALPFMRVREMDIGPVRCRVLRVSYSGELGFELHCAMDDLPALFASLERAGSPHGLALAGARALASLRLEKGYRSWGPELNTEITPAMAGLERFCRVDKGEFLGRDRVVAERAAPPQTRLATLVVDAANADCWGSEPVLAGGAVVGYVTSGGYGWRVRESLAVALIPRPLTAPGTSLEVEILGERRAARVARDPVYDRANERLRA